MNKASCLSLLSNAVLVWNTIKIGNIVGQLRAARLISESTLHTIRYSKFSHSCCCHPTMARAGG
jgi:hypothetical protein